MSFRSKVKKVLVLLASEKENPSPNAVERTRQAAYELVKHHVAELSEISGVWEDGERGDG